MSNNRNFHASKEEPRSGKFDGTGFKTHITITVTFCIVYSIFNIFQSFVNFFITEDTINGERISYT